MHAARLPIRSSLLAAALFLLPVTNARAVCGSPASGAADPTATDALHILNSAVGTAACTLAACDVTADCSISASDALTTLLAAIGRDISLLCNGACPAPSACGSAAAPVCNGTCPYGSACSAGEIGNLEPDPRITVCHGEPPATVTISLSDLDEHLAHGDRMRPCEDDAELSAAAPQSSVAAADGDAAACACVAVVVPTTTSTTTTTTTTSTSTSVTLPAPPTDDPDNDGLVGADDPCPSQPLNQCYGPTAVDRTAGLPIRINADAIGFHACSGNRIDCNGRIWLNDFGYNKTDTGAVCDIEIGGGCSIRNIEAIFGCTSQFTEHLFLCEHFDREPEPPLHYAFDLPNGRYLINFLFANTFKETRTIGSRVFDVAVEGKIVLNDFDQVAVAGASRVALVRSVLVEVADGNGLQIEFGHVVENPAVKAIEILAAPAS